jgi:hypothetical protein
MRVVSEHVGQAINEKKLSLGFGQVMVEIVTFNSQGTFAWIWAIFFRF